MFELVTLALLGISVAWNMKHWRASVAPVSTEPPIKPARRREQRRWPPLTMVAFAFNALLLVMTVYVASRATPSACEAKYPKPVIGATVPGAPYNSLFDTEIASMQRRGQALQDCEAAGGGGGAVLVWGLGDIILGVVWLVTRRPPG